jgi:hypothetical protein
LQNSLSAFGKYRCIYIVKAQKGEKEMLPKNIGDLLSKSHIAAFLGMIPERRCTKAQLVVFLQARVEMDEREYARLLEMFPRQLAVGPNELEELLHCSRVERKRWIKEGKIPVLEYRTFRPRGKDLYYPVHDRRVVLSISQEEIAGWRTEYRNKVQERRISGWRKASEQRKKHRQMRHEFAALWHKQVEEWQQRGSLEIALVLQLAYWTVAASHWAKENHIKHVQGTTRAASYAALRDAWYRRKHEAMYVLSQTPYANLSFYRPDDHDKMTLQLCDKHYEIMREGSYGNIWDFYAMYTEEVENCIGCLVQLEKDYYSLYFLEITVPFFPELRFSFHIPYVIGKDWLPPPEKLPLVEHEEQDGYFRFGRSVSPYEKIVQREQDVQIFLERALHEVRRVYHVDGMHAPPLP